MNIQQPTIGRNPSHNLSCPHCHTQLPSQAQFCSCCGKRVEKKKNREWETHIENDDGNTQEWEADTVRVSSLSQTYLKPWQLSRSLKNTTAPEQPHINSPLPQDAEAPMSSPLVLRSLSVIDRKNGREVVHVRSASHLLFLTHGTNAALETEIPRTESADTRIQREAPIPIELLQSLPTTSAPSTQQTWQRIPETEVRASKPPGSNWLWPIIIILSALAAGLVNFVLTDIAIRPVIVFWFLVVCPGMVLVRFLRLKEPVVEWVLALALSFAIEALIAGIQLYAGKWSPAGTLRILIGLSLAGATAQLVSRYPILRAIPPKIPFFPCRFRPGRSHKNPEEV